MKLYQTLPKGSDKPCEVNSHHALIQMQCLNMNSKHTFEFGDIMPSCSTPTHFEPLKACSF